MLKVSSLGCEWENEVLFSSLTFELGEGTAFVVSGANGVGKSTLLRILTGLLPPSTGTIKWQDQILKARDPNFLSKLLYIGHKVGIQSALTPLENLEWMAGVSYPATLKERQRALEAVGLGALETSPCTTLSKGQRQRLALARLWLNPPMCWVLDEPFTALDDIGVNLLQDRFLTHLKQGGILIVATHHKIALNPYPWQEIRLGVGASLC